MGRWHSLSIMLAALAGMGGCATEESNEGGPGPGASSEVTTTTGASVSDTESSGEASSSTREGDSSSESSMEDSESDSTDSETETETDEGSESGSDTGDPMIEPAFEVNGRLRVDGGQLVNQYGHAIQLRGMSTHGLQWYERCVTPESLDVLTEDWGSDILRTAVYIQEGGYETKPQYFRDLIDRLVHECHTRGIYCLVDWHVLNPGDPNFSLDLALEFFEHVAKSHGDKGNIIYEICSEPSGVEWAEIKSYANAVIPVIRAHDPDSVIVVGTPRWSSQPQAAIGDPIEFDNIIYSMHFYASDHGKQFMDYVEDSVAEGIGVFVTEFGTQQATGDGPNNFEASQAWLDLLAKHKISWVNWNFSDDLRSAAIWKEGSCEAGAWTEDQLKPSGAWVREHLLYPPDDWPTD